MSGEPVRTLLVTNIYPRDGALHEGTFVRNIARQIGADSAFRVRVCRLRRELPRLLAYGLFQARILFDLCSWSPRLVYVHYISHSGLAVLLASPFMRRTAIMLHCHGSDVAPGPSEGTARRWWKNRLSAALLRRAALVVTPSHYFEGYVREHFGYTGHTLVSPSGGVDRRVFHADGRVESTMPRLLFAGRMIEGKGAVAAAVCVRTLVENGREIAATFIGDGECAHSVDRELAACPELSLERQPHLDQPGLAQAMRRADLLLFPSIHESLGLTMIEAVFCGALPVVRDNGAMREVIPADIADELIADSEVEFQRLVEALLARDRAYRARLVQRLQAELVPRFDAAQIAEHLNHALLAAARGQSGDSARRAVL